VLKMPWWVVTYFAIFGVITAFWLKSELPDKAERPYLAVELISEACLAVVALGYWLAPVRATIGSVASALFVAGCAWLLLAGVREFRGYVPDPEMSRTLNAVSFVVGIGVYLLLSFPLLYWGFSFAVRGNVAGT
jgi:hypothetical protein